MVEEDEKDDESEDFDEDIRLMKKLKKGKVSIVFSDSICLLYIAVVGSCCVCFGPHLHSVSVVHSLKQGDGFPL